jgi:hypothetical protein
MTQDERKLDEWRTGGREGLKKRTNQERVRVFIDIQHERPFKIK